MRNKILDDEFMKELNHMNSSIRNNTLSVMSDINTAKEMLKNCPMDKNAYCIETETYIYIPIWLGVEYDKFINIKDLSYLIYRHDLEHKNEE